MIRSLVLKNPVLISFLLSSTLLLIRCIDRIQHASLWGEDGTIYLSQAYADPVGSLTTAFAGYYQVVPRLVAYFVSLYIPIEFLPGFICLTSLLCYTACVSIFAGKGYRWIIPANGVRILTVIAFCFLPGLNEMAGNVVNLTGFFMFFLALIFLKDLRVSHHPVELIVCILAIFTQGGCILFLPVACARFWIKLKNVDSGRNLWEEALIIAAILSATLFAFSTGGSVHNPKSHDMLQYALVEIRSIFALFILYPLSGDFTKEFMSVLLAPYLIKSAVKRLKAFAGQQKIILYGVIAGVLAYPLLTFLVRAGSSAAYSGGIGTTEFHHSRYSYLLPALGLIFWMAILIRIPRATGSRKFLPSLLFVLFSTLSAHRFFIKGHDAYSDWKSHLPELKKSEATGCPHQVVVPISPPGWTLTYLSPKRTEHRKKGEVCP